MLTALVEAGANDAIAREDGVLPIDIALQVRAALTSTDPLAVQVPTATDRIAATTS